MKEYIVELQGVTVRKSGATPLKALNFCVAAGEFVGIIGPNGAGKSTLLNVIAGFERFEGKLNLFGHQERWRRTRSARLRLGYMPQSLQTDPSFPILASEVVMTGAIGRIGMLKYPNQREQEEILRLMEMMQIDHLAERPLGQLSGGERQKVALARALVQKPDILLMDEPTANLDMAIQQEFLNLLCEIHQRKSLTVLFVTHDFSMLPKSMRRILMLKRGQKVFDGDIAEALAGETLSKLFQYPLETFERHGRRFVSYG